MSPAARRRGGKGNEADPPAPSSASADVSCEPLIGRQRVGFTEMAYAYFPGSEVCRGIALGPGAWVLVIVSVMLLLGLMRLIWGEYDAIDLTTAAAK